MIYGLADLNQAITLSPDQWRPLVLTNGCFDLIHAGHVRYLKAARELGRSLVVGLNSDASIQQIKPSRPGVPPRPIVPEKQRAEVVAALSGVSAVVLFSENTAEALVQALKPDIYVKGGDYSLETLPEAQIVLGYGGRVELVQVEVPISTTAIINRIRGLPEPRQ
jgi:rfaE bifunctional protein nucleotidyltransferase chain/domain